MNRLSMDPGNVRTGMHAAYERYLHGVDRYPRMKLLTDPGDFPRKSQGIARALFRAWEVIDEDREFFEQSVLATLDALGGINREDGGGRIVITRIGRNVVNLANVVPGLPPQVTVGSFDRTEFVREFEGMSINLSGGGNVTLIDGRMQGDFDAAIVRRSNVAGIYLGTPPSPTVEDVSTVLV